MTVAAPSSVLTPAERRHLLAVARRAIEAAAAGLPEPPIEAADPSPALERDAAVFVSLHQHGELRGCIGSLEADTPLVRAVAENACRAAFEDPRFPAVTPAEVASLEIEISVLGPFLPVGAPESIVVGRDGLRIRQGWRSGLLLPQVPVEWGWSREEFLEHVCRKGGFASGSWRSGGVILEKFCAEVFSESTELQRLT